jgi:hypothetical protein
MILNQVFPSGHRGTGNGVAIGLNRIMGIVSAVVGDAANATNVSPSVLTQNRIFDRFTNDLDRQTRQFQYISARHSTLSWQLYPLCFRSSRTADEAVEYFG